MSTDEHIQRALEIGEKNKRTSELIRNWCANVSIKKLGGGGLVEFDTGLPIGPRSLECQHARAPGMAGSDLALIALNFHDRNCVDCKFRQPVGLPNLTTLVSERDAHRAQQQQAQQRAEREVAERLAARESSRQQMRGRLETMAATTLDQISELDRSRSNDPANRLVQVAELAPETFAPEIVEHLFSLIESKEYWLIDPSLAALARLPVDKARLCNNALSVLRTFGARDTAATIIEAHCKEADPAAVCEALPELIQLANPAPSRFGLGERRSFLPGPLKAAYRLHMAAVKNGLKALLDKKDAESVRTAARGLEALTEEDTTLSTFLMHELAAKLARAKWLIQGREEEVEEAVRDVRGALTRAFTAEPQGCDTAIASYLNGATPEGADELHHVYYEVLWKIKHPDEEIESTVAHRVAFRRMVAAATQTENEKIAETAREVFRGAPYGLTPIAGEEIDLLLGSAATVAVKLEEMESSRKDALAKGFFDGLEWMNRRSSLVSSGEFLRQLGLYGCWPLRPRLGAEGTERSSGPSRGQRQLARGHYRAFPQHDGHDRNAGFVLALLLFGTGRSVTGSPVQRSKSVGRNEPENSGRYAEPRV